MNWRGWDAQALYAYQVRSNQIRWFMARLSRHSRARTATTKTIVSYLHAMGARTL